MAEYIEREAVKAEFKKNFAYGQNENFAKWLERVACDIVDKVPASDVQLVIYAHKTINVGRRSYCSNCGKLAIMEDFCSKCGAKVEDGDTNG